jgi:hypothetical protein
MSLIDKEKINEKIKEYVAWITDAASRSKELSILIKDGELDPNRLNLILAEYISILNYLINEQERYLRTLELYTEEFDKWFDKKYIEIRDKINNDRLASKIATKEEIRTQVKVEYTENYYDYQQNINDIKAKERYYSKQIKKWEKYESILKTISYNIQTEMNKLDFSYLLKKENMSRKRG